MEWNVVAAAIVSWVGQVVKSRNDIPTWAAQAGIGVLAFVLYALGNLPSGLGGAEAWMGWVRDGLGWALAVIGGSSALAGIGLAPKTDSK